MTKRLTRNPEDAEAGAFIGFDSSNESDSSEDQVIILFLNFKCPKLNFHINIMNILNFIADEKQCFVSR